MIGAFAAELRKAGRRPAVWICLGVLVAILVGIEYVVVWFVFSHPPPNFEQSLPKGTRIADLKAVLHPLHFHRQVLGMSSSLGSAMALVVGVLSVGSEYGWNTFKTLLTQRPGRLVVLTAKLAVLTLLMLLFAIVVMVAGALTSVAMAGVDGAGTGFPSLDTVLRATLAAWLMYTVWAFFGAFLAFAFRQSALAIGLGLVYALVVEGLIFQLLGLTGSDWFKKFEQWFPAANTNGLTRSFGQAAAATAQAAAPLVTGTHAALVLLAYAAAFVAGSAALLRLRDVD